jgi:hypothetical protein
LRISGLVTAALGTILTRLLVACGSCLGCKLHRAQRKAGRSLKHQLSWTLCSLCWALTSGIRSLVLSRSRNGGILFLGCLLCAG